VKPTLGRRKLGDVKVKQVREFVSGLYNLRKSDGEPYAQNTLRDVVRVLGALFREASKDGLIPRSPVRDLPSDERPSSQRAREQRYLDPAQVDQLLAEVGDVFRPILLVCGWVGVRVSEALGITWSDLDLDAGTLTIEAQLVDDGARGDTKTENSMATLDLLLVVVTALKSTVASRRRRDCSSSSRMPTGSRR
jgi:integrase